MSNTKIPFASFSTAYESAFLSVSVVSLVVSHQNLAQGKIADAAIFNTLASIGVTRTV